MSLYLLLMLGKTTVTLQLDIMAPGMQPHVWSADSKNLFLFKFAIFTPNWIVGLNQYFERKKKLEWNSEQKFYFQRLLFEWQFFYNYNELKFY
jgi:hypothetical protein